jgi:anaerobic selenocysteine-containing dehydrogenase
MSVITKNRLSRRTFLKGSATAGAAGSLQLSPIGVALAQDKPPAPGSGQWLATTCAGCTTFCAKQVYVQDGRALHVRGNEFCKTTGKAGCARQYLALQELYDQDRVRVPLKRTNPKKGRNEDPKFVPISWDEAIDLLADRLIALRAKGEPHKFMTLQGRYTRMSDVIRQAVPNIVGSRNAITHSSICAETDKFGPFYMEGNWGYRQYDLANVKYQILFGADPLSANRAVSSTSAFFGEAMARGGAAVVDPRLSATAAKADEWLPIKPGEDSALALALAHVILTEGLWHKPFVGDFKDGVNRFKTGVAIDEASFNEMHTHGLIKWWNSELRIRTPEWAQPICGIPASQIRRVAAKLGAAAPNVGVWMSRGMHMNRRGAYASMCGHALSGLLGATDNEGGTMRYQSAPRQGIPSVAKYQDEIAQAGVKKEYIDRRGRLEFPAMASGRPGSGVVANQIADSILTGDPYPIEVVLAYWVNYPFSAPGTRRWEEALAKVPFVAHVTTNISELTWYADVVFPANHHMFEAWGINDSAGQGYGHLSLHQPVVKSLNGGVDVELGIPWLLGIALEKKGFPNLANYLRNEFADPETKAPPRSADEFALYAVKRATQPIWDPKLYKSGDKFDGWEHFRKVGVWNSTPFAWRKSWGAVGTKTKKFEFYSETLKDALWAHAQRHKVTADEVLEKTGYEARGELAFIPHYESQYRYGAERDFPLLFVDHKSRLTREGRGTNGQWFQANKDLDLGDEKWADVVKINPADARRYGIKDGQQVRLTTVAGSIVCQAKVWEGVRPGTLAKAFGQGHWAYGRYSAKDFGRKPLGGNNNDIIPVDYDRLTGSSVFAGNIGVRIERA